MFPEIKERSQAVYDAAEPGTEYIINQYRDANQNLRTQLERIIRRVGLEPWPKLFQNLRSTRQTELEETYPSHVVCAWIGNSHAVAAKHYLQVTDEHFEKAVQNAVHHPTATNRTDPQKTESCGSMRAGPQPQIAGAGLEPARGLPLTGF